VTIRPMRGQAVIREVDRRSSILYVPEDKEQRTHRGIVLALGSPAQTPTGAEVPWDCMVGDEVFFSWQHNEREFTKIWTDGKKACWIPQTLVHAVVEP
jgi:co-chaperonin GroES (HSP10)